MKALGIRIKGEKRNTKDLLSPDFPLLAASYTRNGFIRLAAERKRAPNVAKAA